MITVGTAGHIDHGKSAIVKRLTGTDPDRLPEEKARGLTIDLGFAFYRTAGSEMIGFVDVPGHERFVKNMIAGAGGIDSVMLVIAANDGWMPQSQEHFQIVRLLGIPHGFIVINKIDLVEPDWLDLLKEEVKEKVSGSFLEKAPVFTVSATTGEGFEELKKYLEDLPGIVDIQRNIDKARLYIDRSFIRPGIGGVVTGTLRGGKLAVGQPVSVWPSMKQGRIRTMHSHNQDVTESQPSQRTAMSFTGIEKDDLVRGGVISDRLDLTYFNENPVLVMSVEMLAEAPLSLNERRRVVVLVGTTEVEGEVRLYERREIHPGEKGLIFFKPDDPAYALIGDHYIMRLITPMVTLGGGRILELLPRFPRKRELGNMEYLKLRQSLTLDNLIISELQKNTLTEKKSLLENASYSNEEIADTTRDLIKAEKIAEFKEFLLHPQTFENVVNTVREELNVYFESNPHIRGLSPEQINRLTNLPEKLNRNLLDYMVENKLLVRDKELFNLPGRGMVLKGVIKDTYDKIMAELKASPMTPPTLSDLASGGKINQQVIKYILESGEGYKCGSDFIFLKETWLEIIEFIKGKLADEGELKVADFKNNLGLTRKFSIPVLEETDRLGITQRKGDIRIKGDKFES